jgi:hypothetical protein
MCNILFDSPVNDADRRQKLYSGNLFVYSPCPSAIAMSQFAQDLIADAFAPYDPRTAQHDLPVERFVEILAGLKPRFIHHPESKRLIQGILQELGCDLDKTYFDVPRMRTSTSDNYLTSGIAYAFHPHRDTWYSAAQCQINWWFPIYDVSADNVMAFHPHYWDHPIQNSSHTYNYYQWNQNNRQSAAKHVKNDTRIQPKAEEPFNRDPDLRVVCNPGGVMLFSAAQMHSTVPNTSGKTRFSIDFRTVHFDDVASKMGSPNIDSACTGTSLRDFLRASDFDPMPEELAALYNDGSEAQGMLVYKPT